MARRESRLPQDWFDKADKDLRRVDALLAIDDVEGAGFHLQQAAEKYLKGYLLGQGCELKRTHDLEDLLNAAVSYDEKFEAFRDACRFTTEFYVEQRYPFILSPPPPIEKFHKAMSGIRQMVEYIVQKIS